MRKHLFAVSRMQPEIVVDRSVDPTELTSDVGRAFDQDGVQTELARPGSRGQTCRPSPDYDNLSFVFFCHRRVLREERFFVMSVPFFVSNLISAAVKIVSPNLRVRPILRTFPTSDNAIDIYELLASILLSR
jgi:hypothetical protein